MLLTVIPVTSFSHLAMRRNTRSLGCSCGSVACRRVYEEGLLAAPAAVPPAAPRIGLHLLIPAHAARDYFLHFLQDPWWDLKVSTGKSMYFKLGRIITRCRASGLVQHDRDEESFLSQAYVRRPGCVAVQPSGARQFNLRMVSSVAYA